MTKILIIGSGGREHSIGISLKKSPKNPTLYFAPGNAGTELLGTNIPIKADEIQKLLNFAKENTIALTIVGPEDPLVLGIVDLFHHENLKIIGPDKKGAQLEGSKKWAKNLMKKYNIPTASYESFTDFTLAKDYILSQKTYPIVIKADGLAAGKGVTIANSQDEALIAIEDCLLNQKFKDAGSEIIIEDFLEGDEASLFAFTDSKVMLPMIAAQDHKAINDGDTGPNTGGMGAYCPTPLVTPDLYQEIQETVFTPLLNAFKEENICYKGIVYAGLMISKSKKVSIVKFNVRFGDPETQVVLPLLNTDLLSIFESMTDQTLSSVSLDWSDDTAICVVLASGGYPEAYEKGKEINGPLTHNEYATIIHAGTQNDNNTLKTAGGRVLGVVSKARNLDQAITKAYQATQTISFDNMVYRKDIGQKAKKYKTYFN